MHQPQSKDPSNQEVWRHSYGLSRKEIAPSPLGGSEEAVSDVRSDTAVKISLQASNTVSPASQRWAGPNPDFPMMNPAV